MNRCEIVLSNRTVDLAEAAAGLYAHGQSIALGGDKRSLALRLVEAAKQTGSKAAMDLAQKGAEHGATQLVELVQGWLSD